MGLVEALCFSNPAVRLHVVITHKSAVLILGTVKTSHLTNVSVVVHIVDGIFGFRVVTKVGLKCSRVFTCTCKLVHIVVPLLAACLGAGCGLYAECCVECAECCVQCAVC